MQSSIQVVLTNSAADHHPDVDPTDPFLEMQLAPVRALDNMSGWLFVRLGAIARTFADQPTNQPANKQKKKNKETNKKKRGGSFNLCHMFFV